MAYKNYWEHTFHDTVTTTGNGTEFKPEGRETLVVEIYGTSSTRTITFYAKGKSGTLRALSGVKLSDLSVASSTTGSGELWQFDTSGLESVVMTVTAVAGGNVTIKGRAVA
jgi:hypothetical protein